MLLSAFGIGCPFRLAVDAVVGSRLFGGLRDLETLSIRTHIVSGRGFKIYF